MKVVIDSQSLISNGEYAEPNDNFVFECEDYCIGLYGIVLNNEAVDSESIKISLINGETQKKYKGSYVMWLYDKTLQKVYIANDLLSKQSVYFYNKDGLILVNTSLFDLCADLRKKGREPEINFTAVDYFLKNNVFYGDLTYESNTRFLTAYSYIEINCKTNTLTVNRLPIPKMKPIEDISVEGALDKLEEKFSEGCHLQWRKNELYKKDQIITTSGGMDSRAVLLHLLNQNGSSTIKSFTYAQSGSNDAKISKKLADSVGIDNTFIPLDNCEFAYQRDELTNANEGQMYYLGSTGAIMMARLCKEKYQPGIIHTGLGGGEILGDMCVANGDIISENDSNISVNQQRNLDDIRRCLNFQKTTSLYFSVFSPFLYEDFFEYALCLPASLRMHRKLYIQWYKKHMNSNFPSAGSYSLIIKAINRIKTKTYRALRKKNPTDMNPIVFWYDSKPELREYIQATWDHDCELLKEREDLLKLLKESFQTSVIRKFAVLTVTWSAIRILGLDEA